MSQTLQLKRGLEANLSAVTLKPGEVALTLDSKKLVFGGAELGEVVHLTDIAYGAEPSANERHKLWVAEVGGKTFIRKFNETSGAYEDIFGADIVDDVNIATDTVFSSQKVMDLFATVYTQVQIDEFLATIQEKQNEQDGRLTSVEGAVADEKTRAEAAEAALTSRIATEESNRASEITRVEGLVSGEVSARQAQGAALDQKITDEKTARENKDTELAGKIADLEEAQAQAGTDTSGALDTKVDKSTLAQPNGVATLDGEGKLLTSQLPNISKEVRIANTYADLVAIENPFSGLYVFVKAPQDGDATVTTGGATYVFVSAEEGFVKVSEAESMDAVLKYGNITDVDHTVEALNDTVAYVQGAGKKAAIDDAIAKAHVHANATELAAIVANSENEGKFMKIQNGAVVFTNDIDCGNF